MANAGSGTSHPREDLEQIAKDAGMDMTDVRFAELMDSRDPLGEFRKEFHYPTMSEVTGTDLNLVKPDDECIYLCGNSLGLCPKNVRKYANEEIDKWEQTGVQGHRNGSMPWAWCDELLEEEMARIVGAKREEITLMNGLTVNIHLMMISFYRPTKDRYKILLESKAFPSDHYAFESHSRLHGFSPDDVMICMEPREGESTLRTEDILARIEKEGDQIAVVCFSGVQYYTGQWFDMGAITKAGHDKGCYVGWDLAHAVGNVPITLHDTGVDFACWCTYKYLNSGAGGIGGVFLHDKHRDNDFPRLMGWWGHDLSTRFVMDNKRGWSYSNDAGESLVTLWVDGDDDEEEEGGGEMDLIPGARGYRVSNTPAFLCTSLKASLDIFKKTSMDEIRAKSLLLTGYLEVLVQTHFQKSSSGQSVYVDIFTPSDPCQRGAQLSLTFSISIETVFKELEKRGVICDKRLPSVIRIGPAPLYNSFKDIHRFISALQDALAAASKDS